MKVLNNVACRVLTLKNSNRSPQQVFEYTIDECLGFVITGELKEGSYPQLYGRHTPMATAKGRGPRKETSFSWA